MAKQDYTTVEEQIGDLGGETPTTMGKLRHKESYGGKSELNEDEKDEMSAFLARSRKHKEDVDAPISDGWIPIDRKEMGKRSEYYPESWMFYIRPATVQAIKNWTAVDESRMDAVNNVFNEIIKTCVKISTSDGTPISWNQLKSCDRFWLILKVREYTYASSQKNTIDFNDDCSECEQDMTFVLNSYSLFYEFPDDVLVEKYWNGSEWVIDPQEYNVDHDVITLYPPTLGKDEAIINWATEKYRQDNKKPDETFIKFLIWLLPKAVKDAQLLDRQIQNIYKDYKSWSIDLFTFMTDVVNNITINPSEQLRAKCPHCGQEATSTVQFPNGVKVLFEAQTNVKKFGSR